MTIARHIYARAARDRLIDLLGLGETYPLRDLKVDEVQLTVSFDEPSAFKVEPAQEPCLILEDRQLRHLLAVRSGSETQESQDQ